MLPHLRTYWPSSVRSCVNNNTPALGLRSPRLRDGATKLSVTDNLRCRNNLLQKRSRRIFCSMLWASASSPATSSVSLIDLANADRVMYSPAPARQVQYKQAVERM